MSTEGIVDKRFVAICTEILEASIKEIALTFSVSTTEFYDTVHELTFSPIRLKSDAAVKMGVELDIEDLQGYDRTLETVKSKKRLYRIANRLTTNPVQDTEGKKIIDGQVLSEPKIYDDCIVSAMVITYSAVSDMIGDSLFNKLDTTNVERALQIETRIDRLDRRQCFSFTEFAMLVCLYMALNRASVDALNRPMETANQKRKLKGRMQRIKQWLVSDELRDSLVKTFVDLLTKLNEEKYALLIDKHIRNHWLSNEKRHLKYLDYAAEQGYLKFPIIKYRGKEFFGEAVDWDVGSGIPLARVVWKEQLSEHERKQICTDEVEQFIHSFIAENNQLQIYQEFFACVLPVSEMMSLGIVPKDLLKTDKTSKEIELRSYLLNTKKIDKITKEYLHRQDAREYIVSRDEYQLAQRLSDVVEIYIDTVLSSVIAFLECLPEANIAGEKTLREYFNSI